MRLIYRPKKTIVPAGGYGLLYNFYATQEQISEVEFGYLYNWYAATDVRGFVDGWHLPDVTEFAELGGYVLDGEYDYYSADAGGKLKETGLTYWNSPNTGATNELGFNGRGAGQRGIPLFSDLKVTGSFHCSTLAAEPYTDWYYVLDLITDYEDSYLHITYPKQAGHSIRLIKDSTTLTDGQTGTVTIDGKVYNTICIGTQEWMSENLMAKNYADGTPIPEETDNTAWAALTTGARCSYDNLESNAGTTTKITSSDDWVVPTKTQFEDLLNAIDTPDPEFGLYLYAGGRLKESGYTHWDAPNVGAINDLGFNGVGGGYRIVDIGLVYFDAIKNEGCHWTTTSDLNPLLAHAYIFASADSGSNVELISYKETGYSLRLCNPTTMLSEGVIGTYTQNDGTVIPTVVIGGVEWTMNLSEKKWRDGSWIHGFDGGTYTPIADIDWSTLTIPALCVYDNNLSNI